MHHYLDDFIFIGSGNTDHCRQLMMNSFEIMGREFGIPLNKDKTLGLTTCLIFLGLEIDIKTIKPQSCLVLTYWMNKEKIVFKDLESLVGKPFF